MTTHYDRYTRFVTNFCGAESLPNGMDTKIAEAGLDSLGLLDLVLAIENEFKLDVDMTDIDNDTSFREIGQILFR